MIAVFFVLLAKEIDPKASNLHITQMVKGALQTVLLTGVI